MCLGISPVFHIVYPNVGSKFGRYFIGDFYHKFKSRHIPKIVLLYFIIVHCISCPLKETKSRPTAETIHNKIWYYVIDFPVEVTACDSMQKVVLIQWFHLLNSVSHVNRYQLLLSVFLPLIWVPLKLAIELYEDVIRNV